jgi:hypothetical protein
LPTCPAALRAVNCPSASQIEFNVNNTPLAGTLADFSGARRQGLLMSNFFCEPRAPTAGEAAVRQRTGSPR